MIDKFEVFDEVFRFEKSKEQEALKIFIEKVRESKNIEYNEGEVLSERIKGLLTSPFLIERLHHDNVTNVILYNSHFLPIEGDLILNYAINEGLNLIQVFDDVNCQAVKTFYVYGETLETINILAQFDFFFFMSLGKLMVQIKFPVSEYKWFKEDKDEL